MPELLVERVRSKHQDHGSCSVGKWGRKRHGDGRFWAVLLHWDRTGQLYMKLTFLTCIILLLKQLITSHISVYLLGSLSTGFPWSLSCSQVHLGPR